MIEKEETALYPAVDAAGEQFPYDYRFEKIVKEYRGDEEDKQAAAV